VDRRIVSSSVGPPVLLSGIGGIACISDSSRLGVTGEHKPLPIEAKKFWGSKAEGGGGVAQESLPPICQQPAALPRQVAPIPGWLSLIVR
jgi:hypothetical protein